MSTQIAVRLPDDLAAFVDGEVAAGRAASRAAVVSRALERERRRLLTLADVEILKASDSDPELDAFVEFNARPSIDLD